jgi:predicted MFS family arabinose efflux permease
MAGSAVSLPAYVRLVRKNRNFRRLWLAQIISEMGDWIYAIAIYTLLLELTRSAASVALAVVLQVLPQFFVAPTAGVLNDRLSRKRIMIAADLARASIVLGMLFVSRAQMVPLVYLLLLLETTMWAFFEPGRSAIVPNITDGEDLVAANTLSSMTWSFNLALGSGIGGAIAAFFGRDTVFVLNSLSFVISASLIWGMKFPEPHLDGAKPLRARDLVDFSPIAEGVRYVAKERRLFSLMLVKAGLGLLGTHLVLLPLFGERIFSIRSAGASSGGMLGMSVLMSARGVGALLGPVIGGYWTGREQYRLRMGILIGFITAAAGYLALAASPSLAIASASVVIANAGTSMVWVFSTTLLQIHTDDRFRGRVFSADFAFLVVTMSLSSYGAGLLVDWGVGLRLLAAATGLAAFIPLAAWASAQRLWRVDSERALS